MSLTPELEALVNQVSDPTKREGLRKDLEAGYLRQSDYSRKMNELNETERTRAEAYAKGIKWVEDNRQNYSEAVRQLKETQKKAEEFEKISAQLNSRSAEPPPNLDIDMTNESEVAKALKEARQDAARAREEANRLAQVVQSLDEKISKGQFVTADQFQTEAAKQLEAYSRATMDVIETRNRAQREYGLDVSRDAILNEAAKYGGDLEKAYENVTAAARLEKIKAEIRKEVTQEVEAKFSNNNTNPLATGAPPLMGPLQQRVFAAKNPESTIDAAIPADGSGRLAHAMAAELRAEGKS